MSSSPAQMRAGPSIGPDCCFAHPWNRFLRSLRSCMPAHPPSDNSTPTTFPSRWTTPSIRPAELRFMIRSPTPHPIRSSAPNGILAQSGLGTLNTGMVTGFHTPNAREPLWTIQPSGTASENQPPLLNPIGNQSTPAGSGLSLTINASDPEGQPVEFSATGNEQP